jgi:hypothetical protein
MRGVPILPSPFPFGEIIIKEERAGAGPIHEGVGAPEPAKAGTPNVWSPGFSRFVWRFTSKVGLHELALGLEA